MLWYKAWLDTRWRFLAGLGLLVCASVAVVFAHAQVAKILPAAVRIDSTSELGREIAESAALLENYRSYIWSQWFRQNMRQLWALFAVLLGTGGLLAQHARGGALFTLSLPVSRQRLLGTRAATALAELAALAFVPSLLLPVVSPAVGQSYPVGDALVYGTCIFVAGSMLFSLTFLLSTVFEDVWRPPLIVLCLTAVWSVLHQIAGLPSATSLLGLMTGETYFRTGTLPWIGLLSAATASAGLLYLATRNIARQDF
jgi:hypothetical protein